MGIAGLTPGNSIGGQELTLWFVGSERLALSLATVCRVEALRPDDWRSPLAGAQPSFLLVEGSAEVERSWGEELNNLLRHCDDARIPAFLWIVTSPVERDWLDRCPLFDRVFAAELWQVPELEAAGAPEPTTLWPGTALPLDVGSPSELDGRTDPVVWLGGWNDEWPLAWRERLASVLRGAATRGLRIYPVAPVDALPTDLRSHLAAAPREDAEPLRRAKVAIGADPTVGSSRFTPAVVFDAAACGAAVITPHDFAGLYEFGVGKLNDGSWRNTIPIVHDAEATVAEIDRLLDDDSYRTEVVTHLKRIVANNHTLGQRVATLASAAGHSLINDAEDPAPA